MADAQRYVWLNNVRLRLKGTVVWHRVTPFPNRFATSAPTTEDYTPTRKQTWGALKGGMGLEKWTAEDNDRYWTADGIDASLNVQMLSPLVTTMGTFGVEPVKIIKYGEHVWAIGHKNIAYWSGTAWTLVKTDFPNPTDAITFYGVT